MGKLTDKQELFCQEYIIDHNASKACLRAGYKTKNPDVVGPNLVGKSWVKARIDKLEETLFEKLEITQEKVLKERSAIAFSRINDHLDMDAFDTITVKNFKDMTPEALASIKKIEQKSTVLSSGKGEGDEVMLGKSLKVELWDKQKELDKLAINLGLDKDQGIDLSNLKGLTINFVESGE